MGLAEIRVEIAKLTDRERTKLLQELAEADAEAWDRQIAGDAKAGKLDALAEEALRDLRAGRCTDL
ncbi:MAG: hypothetical protein WDN28_13655 [Chthoniobacter sp.]